MYSRRRANRDRQVRRRRPQRSAEHGECFHALRICAGQSGSSDLAGLERALRDAVDAAQRLVNVDHPGTAQHTFGGDVPEALAQHCENCVLACVHRAEGDMSALAFERHPARAARLQSRHAQTGAGADQADGLVRQRLTAADLPQLAAAEQGQRQRQGGEVVEHQQAREAELPPRLLDGECPGTVGELDQVAGHGRGHVDRGLGHARITRVRQVSARGLLETGVVGAQQAALLLRLVAAARQQREAHVRAADVGEQPELVAAHHGRLSRAGPASPSPPRAAR
jgi:hypothetical protein